MSQKIILQNRNLCKYIFLFILFAGVGANAVTLETAIENAKKESNEFKKLESDVGSVNVSKVIAVENFLLPSVSLNETRFELNDKDIESNKTNSQTLEVTYSISNLYKGSLFGMSGIYDLNSQNSLLNAGKNNIILEVIDVYFDTLKAEKKITLYKKSLDLNEQILKQTETNAKLGSAKNTTLYLAQSQYEEAKANLELAFNEFEVVKNKFILKVGMEPRNLVEPVQTELTFKTLDELTSQSEKRNFQIQSTKNQRTASKYNLSGSVSDFLPDISVKYERYREHDSLVDTEYSGNRVTINAKFYLYKPGIVSSVVQKSYDYHSSKNNHDFTVLYVKNTAQELWSKKEYYAVILPSKQKIVNIREQLVNEWKTDYTYGRIDLTHLLDEERKLVEAELDLLQIKFESLKNIYQIKNISGERLF